MNRYQRRNLRRTKRMSGVEMAMADLTESDDNRLEKAEQAAVCRLYRDVFCRVVSFSQPRATKQTEGIPDLKIYCERKGLTWWFETKRQRGGKQSHDQKEFQRLAEQCGETYVLGGRKEAYAHLVEVGIIPKEAA